MNSVLDRIKKNSTIKEASLLRTSKIFGKKDSIPTPVPMINVALSGDPDGGLQPGVLVLAGPSKHFKTLFGLLMAAAYMKKYPEAVLLFYDSEFGTPEKYFDNLDIDKDRVVHTPITDIEQLKSDMMNQLKEINRGDKVVVLIDSIGNLASIKEIEDALEGKQVADMTRARALKSFYRMVTPHLTIKDIPMIAINHTYKEMCLDGSTLIKSERGILPIKDIKVGDRVYALTGLQTVLAAYTPEQLDATDKKFLEVEFDDGSIVRCTHDHEFLLENKEWKKAIDMKIGQIMY